MFDLLKILSVFGFILLLLKKKVQIGIVMLVSSFLMFLLYGMNLDDILTASKKAFLGSITIKLLLSLSLIRVFELVLRENNVLSSMMTTVRALSGSRKAVTISMPVLIGMLPSLGGAYFSAPMVKEATDDLQMSQEEKAFINYWFRHPWEFMLPLYPGIIFAAAVTGVPLNRLVIANIAYGAAMAATGFIFSMRSVRSRARTDSGIKEDSGNAQWQSFIPITAILALVLFFRIELHYSLILVLLPLFIFYRYSAARILQALRYGFSWDVVLMIAGIVLFKETMEASGAVAGLSSFFMNHGVPVLPVFCLLPFIAGLMTGHTVGFVGTTFPLLLSIFSQASLPLISLSFASGLMGVLLSPVHLCLILSREYFRADLSGIYRRTVPAAAVVFAVAFAEYLILG